VAGRTLTSACSGRHLALLGAAAEAGRAARKASAAIPIVAGSDDLVGEGHAVSLARPGGNVTGVSILAAELNAKRLEVLKAAVPVASRIAAFWHPATGEFHLPALHAVAHRLAIELNIQEVRRADDLSRAFEAVRASRAEAVNVLASPLVFSLRQVIIDQAARMRLPAIYQWSEAVREGELLSYGPTRAEVFRALAAKIDRVVGGAKASDLPVERPTTFELVINLKTAKALGLTMVAAAASRSGHQVNLWGLSNIALQRTSARDARIWPLSVALGAVHSGSAALAWVMFWALRRSPLPVDAEGSEDSLSRVLDVG